MILSTFQETGRSAGGGAISWVGDFIAHEEMDFGPAIRTLEVTVHANTGPDLPDGPPVPVRRAVGVLRPREMELPKATFRKKEGRLLVSWLSRKLTPAEMESWWKDATHSIFVRAVQDVHDAAEWGLSRRLTDRDDFDAAACLAWIRSAAEQAPRDEAELRLRLREGAERHMHLLRTRHFHEKLAVDWAAMHGDAAHLLYHPDLWNETDARMPHGNPLGHEILANFARYEGMSLAEVLSSLGLPAYEAAADEDGRVRALQAELALVFAHIKKTGTVGEAAVRSLVEKMVRESKSDRSFWVHRSSKSTGSHFSWMYTYLERFANMERPNFELPR